MDDALLVGVLNARADLQEELEALSDREAVLVAVVGDRLPDDGRALSARPPKPPPYPPRRSSAEDGRG